jgi:phospholipid/cholesterol/gamma-HCH transport system ATP-binding protein
MQNSAAQSVIEMENVSAGSLNDVGAVTAQEVNWRVATGDFWVIAGLQGSGKSDFLMMTAGLMAPVSGSYRLFGERMPIFDEERLPVRLRLGLVFDGGQLFNQLTVWENVALPMQYHRDLTKAQAEEPVRKLLDAVGMGQWADLTPGALGRIWHKRVGLARALSLEPELLLLDNPLTGLDMRHAAWWLKFLDELSQGHPAIQGRPITLVVSAADLRPWKSHARQVAVLRNRRLEVAGAWEQIDDSAGLVEGLLPAQ